MFKFLFFSLFIFFITAFEVYSQNTSDTIAVEKWLANSYKQNNKMLNLDARIHLMEGYDDAYKEAKKARTNCWVGNISLYAGVGLIAYPLSKQVMNWMEKSDKFSYNYSHPDWTYAVVGVLMVAFSVPFQQAYKKRSLHSVHLYNNHIKNGDKKSLTYQFGLNESGLRLSIGF